MLDNFFITGEIPAHAEKGFYIPQWVLASLFVASIGSYIALTFTNAMRETNDPKIKNILHVAGAITFGCGIWAMHFIGMLSYKMTMLIKYDATLTVASMLIAMAIAFMVLWIARSEKLSLPACATGAVLLGTAISGMHYVGMAAMNMDADLRYQPSLFFVSVTIAVMASGAALQIVFALKKAKGIARNVMKIVAAAIMGVAICGMHYTGMAAAVFVPFANCRRAVESENALAIPVVIVTACIFMIGLGVSLFLKEHQANVKKTDYPFPLRLLAASSGLTFLAIIWASGSSFYFHKRMTTEIKEDMEINRLGDKITYYDALMTRALNMAMITRDEKWEAIYNDSLKNTNEATKTLEELTYKNADEADDALVYQLTKRIDRNDDFFLGELENRVFDSLRNNKREEARTLIESPEYIERKQSYSDDVNKLSTDTTQILAQTLSTLGHVIYFTFYVGIFVIVILPVAWLFAFRSLRHWRSELERTRKNLLSNEKQLQRFIGEIEMSRNEAVMAREQTENESRMVALLRNVSATANQVSNIDNAIKEILELVCEYMNCPVGHAYVRDRENDRLHSTKLWYLKDPVAYRPLVEITEIIPVKMGVDIPGQAWKEREPVVIINPAQNPNCTRLLVVPELKVKTGLAFPLIVNEDVAYILEFFFTQALEKNDTIIHILQEIGNQLVLVIERAHAGEILKKAKEAAEKANISKSEFLANMSHELRTPLNSILGMLRLLKEAKLPKEEYDMAEVAYRSSTNLLTIVNDILDLSKIEAGAVTLESIGMDLNYAIRSVVLTLYPIAKEKRLSLTWHNETDKYPYVLGDPTRFVRVLTNLVGNAIKYTNEGHVDLRTSIQKIDETSIEFHCEISDTGIGIPKDKLHTIFDKFTQADNSTTRKFGGTGLGLAITKQLVELMHGIIAVESEAGEGSTFSFSVPFAITDTLSEEKHIHKNRKKTGTLPAPNARVLVAEDQLMNQILIKKLLKKFNIGICEIAGNGAEVLKAYVQESWDVILMDCHMPEKNGYDATREIRMMEKETGMHVPIVAMTANAMMGDREECLRAGMDEYTSKPINIEELKEILSQWIILDGVELKNESV